MPPLVIYTETLDDTPAQWLAQRVELARCSHEDQPRFGELLQRAQGLLVRTYTRVTGELLAQAPNLKVVGRAGVGLDNIDVPACRSRRVEVVYTPDANTQAVVEYVIALILDDLRPRTVLTSPVSEKAFHELRKTQVGRQMDQLTLGILGFGRIGKRLGKAAHAIGMKVIANDLLPEIELRKAVDYPFDFVDKEKLCRESDILSVHVDGRDENHELINAGVFARLKRDCLFINAARGMLVDSDALARWARSNLISGARAILDVHEPEPPRTDYVLYGQPNVKLLPHLASRTHLAMENMSWVVRDVLAVIQGETPQYPAP